MSVVPKTIYCIDCGAPMKAAVGYTILVWDTATGEQCEHCVRLLSCPKKRWFQVVKHPTQWVSLDDMSRYFLP